MHENYTSTSNVEQFCSLYPTNRHIAQQCTGNFTTISAVLHLTYFFLYKWEYSLIYPYLFDFLLRGTFRLSSIMFIEIQYCLYRRGYARAVSSAFAVVPHAARAQCVAVTWRAARPPNHKEPLPCHITPYEPLPCHITPIFLFRQGKKEIQQFSVY